MKDKKGIRVVLLLWVLSLVAVTVLVAGASLQYFSPALNTKILGLVTNAKDEYKKHFGENESEGAGGTIAAAQAVNTTANLKYEEAIAEEDFDEELLTRHTNRPMTESEIRSAVNPDGDVNDYGFIYVKSNPDGATVIIDGSDVGRAPVTAKVSPIGIYRVEIISKYYDVFDKNVQVYPAEVTKVHATLEKGEGTLTVISVPEEAAVYLDGEMRGKSPLSIKTVEAGPHELHVVKDNKEYEANIEILAGESIIVNASLDILRTPLTVKSKPDGATVYLDGKKRAITPAQIDNVRVGRHQIVLLKKNLAFVDSVQVSPEKDNVLSLALQNKDNFPESFSARVKISSELENAFTYVNGIYCGVTPVDIDEIKVGENEILVVQNDGDGAYFYKKTLSFDSNETKEVTIRANQFKFRKRN